MIAPNLLRALCRTCCVPAALLWANVLAAQTPSDSPFTVTLPTGAKGVLVNPGSAGPQIVNPLSGQAQPGRAHTNVKVIVPAGGRPKAVKPAAGPPLAGYLFETPASLACIYRLVTVAPGCNPNVVATNPTGGSHAIAIVDAYDYPTAASDLAAYSAQFGLAAADFHVIWGTGNPANGCVNGAQPPDGSGSGWDLEAALDIEIAHATAPSARIYLVEANSNSSVDLLNAVAIATKCLQANGGGQQSNSWGGDEFSGETAFDSFFTGAGVTYFASAGDNPGAEYPAVSPNVIAVGGTTISRNQNTGAFQSEAVWNDAYARMGTGGGPSAYEARPSYQNGIAAIVGNHRGTPDLAAVADPLTGVWIYNTPYVGGWAGVGGTSLAAPLVAAIVNRSGYFWSSSFAALSNIYSLASQGLLGPYVTDINSGLCGPNSQAFPNASGQGYDPQYIEATTGSSWDWCTGWGTPHGSH